MLTDKLILLYRDREKRRVQVILKKKGIRCKVYKVIKESENIMPNHDPFNIQVAMERTRYAVNRLDDTVEPLERSVFFLKRMGDLYHDNEIVGDMTSLRNDYVAYISDVDEVYECGDVIEFNGISGGRFIIHKVFKHRDYSVVRRYLLSREFDGTSENK